MKGSTHPHQGAPDAGLQRRFAHQVEKDQILGTGSRLVVGLSGGVDSAVLLHLLSFNPHLPPLELVAAHFDHGMRPGSQEDRQWVTGLCSAWQIPLRWEKTPRALISEEDARDERHRFLLAVKEEEDAEWVLTGHHADDQVETVLFRLIRGTGLRGLAGIPTVRSPGFYRPLLPFSRAEILSHAEKWRVPFREDPSNWDQEKARNFLRHSILPELEDGPIPGVKQSIIRLAGLARENEDGWDSLLPTLLEGVREEEDGVVFIVRSALRAYHPAVQIRLLREILREAGIVLDEVGTRVAMEFTRSGASGQSVSLPGKGRLVREFSRLRVDKNPGKGSGDPLVIPAQSSGSRRLVVGGAVFQVEWGGEELREMDLVVRLPAHGLEFPLMMKEWGTGDRIQLPYGTKKLKKLFGEAKIPVRDRERTPILSDGLGRILWIPGVASSTLVQASPGPGDFFLGIRNAVESRD